MLSHRDFSHTAAGWMQHYYVSINVSHTNAITRSHLAARFPRDKLLSSKLSLGSRSETRLLAQTTKEAHRCIELQQWKYTRSVAPRSVNAFPCIVSVALGVVKASFNRRIREVSFSRTRIWRSSRARRHPESVGTAGRDRESWQTQSSSTSARLSSRLPSVIETMIGRLWAILVLVVGSKAILSSDSSRKCN